MTRPVALVAGVGPKGGTGAEIAREFAADHDVALLARDGDRLAEIAAELPGARPYPVDMADAAALTETVARVRAEMGDPAVVVHNAAQAARGPALEIDPDQMRLAFEVNAMALLHLAQATIPAMVEAGRGALLVTSNGASLRGKANWGGFASTKAAQRILAESLAREFGPQGVHVAVFIIDAAIDTPRTRHVHPADRPPEDFMKPSAIAAEMRRIVDQDRSAWSFLVDLRPFKEPW